MKGTTFVLSIFLCTFALLSSCLVNASYTEFMSDTYVDGNLGVGTSSPQYKFRVSPGGAGSGFGVGWNRDGGSGRTDFYNYGQAGVGGFQFWNYQTPGGNENPSNPTALMSISNAGNIGIGVTSPASKLDVNGDVRIRGKTSCGGKLYTDSSGNVLCGTDNVNDGDYSSTNELQDLQSVTSRGSTTSDPIYINNGGAVHIRSPFGTLVSGTGNGGAIYLGVGSSSSTVPTGAIEAGWTGGIPQLSIGVVRDGAKGNIIMDYTGNVNIRNGGTTLGYFRSNGNVGLGTISPTTKLDINGNLRIRGKTSCSGKLYTDSSGNVLCGGDNAEGRVRWSDSLGRISIDGGGNNAAVNYADSASYSSSSGYAGMLDTLGGGHYVIADRYSGWSTRLYMTYADKAGRHNSVHVYYADNAGNADTVDGYHLNQDVRNTASPRFGSVYLNNDLHLGGSTEGSLYRVDKVEGWNDLRLYGNGPIRMQGGAGGGITHDGNADGDTDDLTVTEWGQVGVNANWNFGGYEIYVNGDQYIGGNLYVAGTFSNPSDIKLKQNITKMDYGLDEIMELDAVSYYWNKSVDHASNFSDDIQYGFVAQDVEEVMPEMVTEDGTGYKGLAYTKLIPVLVNSIKEQQEIIEELREEIEELKKD